MSCPSYGDRDPIAALATPLGESALAVIRTSGGAPSEKSGAIDLVGGIFSAPQKLKAAEGNSIVHGWIIDPETKKKIDEVLVSVFRAPKSYTGEDGVDISCHGGIAAVKAVIGALKTAGFREALPGEFTFRAFMNGKLDLTRAESVMELVSAKTGRGREQAVRRLSGALAREITGIKRLLVEVLAGAEIFLDYSEDEFSVSSEDESSGKLPGQALAEKAARKLESLARLWQQERLYADGALAVLAGRPNAGKSSLFNYILREDRSIVTDVPGTTRDWIEAFVSVEDIPLRLVDTAGLRGPAFDAAPDEVERIGIRRSLELLDRADLVIYLVDAARGVTSEDRDFLLGLKKNHPQKPLLVIWNKADLAPLSAAAGGLPSTPLAVSAKTGEGIPALVHTAAALLQSAPADPASESVVAGPGTLRQKELVDSALLSVREALELASRGEPLDIIAPLLRAAIDALGEITGEVSTADILEAMFGKFCVGK